MIPASPKLNEHHSLALDIASEHMASLLSSFQQPCANGSANAEISIPGDTCWISAKALSRAHVARNSSEGSSLAKELSETQLFLPTHVAGEKIVKYAAPASRELAGRRESFSDNLPRVSTPLASTLPTEPLSDNNSLKITQKEDNTSLKRAPKRRKQILSARSTSSSSPSPRVSLPGDQSSVHNALGSSSAHLVHDPGVDLVAQALGVGHGLKRRSQLNAWCHHRYLSFRQAQARRRFFFFPPTYKILSPLCQIFKCRFSKGKNSVSNQAKNVARAEAKW